MSSPAPEEENLTIVLVINRRLLARATLCCVLLLLSWFVVRTYATHCDSQFGWTKMIVFGSSFASRALPRLQRTPHYIVNTEGGHWGYDGQFYAQVAIDPSLQDDAFDHALDLPIYRARRIGLPAAAFVLGGGKPRRILQAYALSNLFCWFVLLGAFCFLLKPRTGRQMLCLCGGMLCFGVIASMERSLIDLPAAALTFAGLAIGSWGGCAVLAGALLTRETSLLAIPGFMDLPQLWRARDWRRFLAKLTLIGAPLAVWMLYVHHRFDHVGNPAGAGNFGLPLQAMYARFVIAWKHCANVGFGIVFDNPLRFEWLYMNHAFFQVAIIFTIFVQGLYLVLRPELGSPIWRIGAGFLILGLVLGPAVWEDPSAGARVLLPLTICFYLRLSHERPRWFWPFFLLGGLSIPYGVHDFWVWS